MAAPLSMRQAPSPTPRTIKMPNRRRTLAWLSCSLATPWPLQSAQAAHDWPSQALTVVVPFAPGGSVDVAARLLMPRLADHLHQVVVVDNTVGASGTLATQRVIKARPDGHTLLFGVASAVITAPLLAPGTYHFDGLRELMPVAAVASSAFVLLGRPDLPAAHTAELLQLARAQPGRLNLGTDGVGTSLHLCAELIRQQAGLQWQHVPYKSGPQVLTELAGRQIDLAVLPVALTQSMIREGRIKAYGVTSRQRVPSLPHVPSLSETPALRDVDVRAWLGVLLPAGCDPSIASRLAQALAAVVQEPAVIASLAEAGFQPMQLSLAAFSESLLRERQAVTELIRRAHIQRD